MNGLWGCYAKWNVGQRKTNTIWSQLYVKPKTNKTETNKQTKNYKKDQSHRYREQMGGWQKHGLGSGQNEWRGSKVQASSYKINKSWGYNVQPVTVTVYYILKLPRE